MASETDFGYRAFDMPIQPDLTLENAAFRWFQHAVVLALRLEMVAGATTRGAVAELLEVTEGHVGRKISGTTALTLPDLIRLLMAFGPSLLPTFASPEELFPPAYRSRIRWSRDRGMARPSLADESQPLSNNGPPP